MTAKSKTHIIVDLAMGEVYEVPRIPTLGGLTAQDMTQAIQNAFDQIHGTGDHQCDNMRSVINISRDE